MLRRCCCIVNVTLFSRVTLNRKLQSTSHLDHFHARGLPCSRVESRDDPISDCRADSAVPYSFIYLDSNLPPILHGIRDIAFDRSKIAIFCYPTRGSSGTISVKNFRWMSTDGQGTKWRRTTAENFNRLSRVHERYRRQTDDRRTGDGI